MNASVSVVCYKSKVLSNGKSPLMLRVTKDRKPKYVSLGIAIFPKYWDFEKNKIYRLRSFRKAAFPLSTGLRLLSYFCYEINGYTISVSRLNTTRKRFFGEY